MGELKLQLPNLNRLWPHIENWDVSPSHGQMRGTNAGMLMHLEAAGARNMPVL